MIKTCFKWIGYILLTLMPIGMFVLMLSLQISRYRFDHYLLRMQANIKPYPAPLSNNNLLQTFRDHPNKPIRILVMNGGGVHGVVQLQVLNYLEKITGKSINQLFDAVGCTSTGCLNLGMLLTPSPNKSYMPAYTPIQIIKKYSSLAATIFYQPWYHKFISLDGILRPAYSSTIKGMLLAQYMGGVTLQQLILPAYICSTQLSSLDVHCFNSWQDKYKHYQAANIINAASSPPAFFYPVSINKNNTIEDSIKETQYTRPLNNMYTDGVLVENDPSLQIVLYMMAMFPKRPIVIVNIGAASSAYSLTSNAVKWSPIRWVINALDIMYQARQNHISQGLTYLVKAHPKQIKYYYITAKKSNSLPFLTGSAEVVSGLKVVGEQMVKDNAKELQQIAKVLHTDQ